MSPEDHDVLAADLRKMVVEARGTLPELAGVYEQSASDLEAAGSLAAAALDLPTGLSSGATYRQWSALRSLLHSVLANTATSIQESAKYLEATAIAYADQDDAARSELEKVMTTCDLPEAETDDSSGQWPDGLDRRV